MARTDKLKTALAKHQGRDFEAEKRKKKLKEGEKRSKAKKEKNEKKRLEAGEDGEEGEAETGGVKVNGAEEEWEDEEDSEDEAAEQMGLVANIDETDDSDSDLEGEVDEDAEDAEEDDDIPLSDLDSLASDDRGDILPHQRLTINNKAALLSALKRISLPSNLPFSSHMTITSSTPTSIPDVEDDLARELAFYKQSLEAATLGRAALKKEGVPFSRPVDYFAEMVKSDEHMGKIKQKLVDSAANKKAAAEARKQRDLKKFGKAVQVAKLQERSKEKRETLEKIKDLKRKRANAPIANENENDLFDVGVEEAEAPTKRARTDRDGSGGQGKGKFKRATKDQKYGFGGKKRHAKSGDAMSSGDMSSYPGAKRMKAGGPGGKSGAAKRPGKARRQAKR